MAHEYESVGTRFLPPTYDSVVYTMRGVPEVVFGASDIDPNTVAGLAPGLFFREGEDYRCLLATEAQMMTGDSFPLLVEQVGCDRQDALGVVNVVVGAANRMFIDPQGAELTGMGLDVVASALEGKVEDVWFGGFARPDGYHLGLPEITTRVIDVVHGAVENHMDAVAVRAACTSYILGELHGTSGQPGL